MVSLSFLFWFMVIFFALIGYLRGWQREVIALTGLIASIAALSQFGDDLSRLISAFVGTAGGDILAARRQEFWIQAVFHALIAFFSYQVVAKLAEQAMGGGLTERLRADLEKRILGALIGAINGYLFIGALWGFLEYRIDSVGYVRLPANECYPFESTVVVRPVPDCFPVDSGIIFDQAVNPTARGLADLLPQGVLSPTIWLILFFLSFFVVIIALI